MLIVMLVVDGLQTGTDTTGEGADVGGGGEWVRVETTTTLELVRLPRSRSHAQISSPRPSAPVLLSSFPFPSPLPPSPRSAGRPCSRKMSSSCLTSSLGRVRTRSPTTSSRNRMNASCSLSAAIHALWLLTTMPMEICISKRRGTRILRLV
ncbi:hypothetical protein OH77DRAFT_1300599 [Trametes cingulata]|nr:hypothetical protein OH77DRAFT_1300599 [Trametes cingulata]